VCHPGEFFGYWTRLDKPSLTNRITQCTPLTNLARISHSAV
jgi:hypothetical protein